MMLVEDGLVRLEDPVTKFLPSFADVQAHFGMNPGGPSNPEALNLSVV